MCTLAMIGRLSTGMLTVFFASCAMPASAQITTVKQTDRVEFLHQGKLITSYLFRSGTKPVLWPIHGPDDVKMTRNYPLDATIGGEDHDHPHHRGLWLTYGEVNGHDWWAEGKGKGIVAHHQIVELQSSGDSATLVAEHHWVPPAETEGVHPPAVVLERCRYTIRKGREDDTIIDVESVLRAADPNQALHFGDTKEGMFAVRVPETMRGDKNGGQILNSVGDRQGDAWGKSAKWVDYSGPVHANQADPYGIAILVHPKSFRADGLWHVRTYGLFAHNPFGVRDFLGNRTKTPSAVEPPHPGGYQLPAGESIHFFYRVIFHRGRWDSEGGNARFKEFAGATPELKP